MARDFDHVFILINHAIITEKKSIQLQSLEV